MSLKNSSSSLTEFTLYEVQSMKNTNLLIVFMLLLKCGSVGRKVVLQSGGFDFDSSFTLSHTDVYQGKGVILRLSTDHSHQCMTVCPFVSVMA